MGNLFLRLYDRFMIPMERVGLGKIRRQLLQKAQGQVLEVGSGTGINFAYYQHAEKVIAIEPQPMMRAQSVKRAEEAPVPIEVIEARGEELPFSDNTFDTVVATLVFCTIPDPVKALHEVRRVCKPDGQILIFEHVRINHPVLGRLQDGLTPVWKQLCDGCHLNRNTLQLIQQAGFEVTCIEKYFKQIFLVIEMRNQK